MKIERFVERDSEILRLVTGKRVLHLGCIGTTDGTHEEKMAVAEKSLHASVTKAAAECTGVDLDGNAVRELRELGVFRNVVEGDVEKLSELPGEITGFDIVVAGDIIEHLSNPGLMLQGVKPLLKPNGVLLVSTPNAFGISSWLKYLTGRFREGAQHVLCFNPISLRQLLERNGFSVEQACACYQARAAESWGGGTIFNVLRCALERFPHLGGTLLYVCRPMDVLPASSGNDPSPA